MKTWWMSLLLFASASAFAADITFVTPQNSGQAIGVVPIEITTTISKIDRVEFSVDGNLIGAIRVAPYRTTHDFGTSLEAHTITAKVYSNGYRDVAMASVITAPMSAGEVYNVDFVEVPLRIRAPRTVRAEEVQVRENGVVQTIRELRQTRGPALFVFVVDRSLSMSGGKLDAALRAIDAESKQLRADDRAEIVLFNHIVSRPRAIARGERIAQVLDDVNTSGGTSLRDAVSSIANDARTYVIVITDGGDRNSETSETTALEKISRTKTVVDAIILGDRSSFLEKAAKNTGGTLARASAANIQRELHDIFLDINSRYTLAYQSTVHTRGWRTLDIQPRNRDISIANARKGYFSQ
jgi:Mg-chelatase subunit ChlD